MQNRTKNAVRGIGVGVINNILSVLLPFLTRTVIIYTLGIQYAGLNSLFNSVINVLNISELGIGGAISFSMYRPIQEGDDAKVCALLAFYRKCYRVIGIVTLIVGICILPFLDKLVTGERPADINLYVLYLVYLINNVLGYFLFAYKKVILSANQRYDVEVSISSVCIILQNIFQIGLIVLVQNYYVYVVIIPLFTLIGNIVSSVAADRMFPQYFCKGSIDKEQLHEIKRGVGGVFCAKIGSAVFLNVDNIIISAFLGLTILGRYGNYYYVIACLIGIFAVIHNSIRPVIGNCLITDTKEKLFEGFCTYQFMYIWLAAWSAICLACMYQNFEFLWAKADNCLPLSVALFLALYFYVGRLGELQEVYLEAAGIYWERRYIPLIAAILNLTLNIILVQSIGLYGIILSTLVSYICVTIPGDLYMVKKYCFQDLLSISKFYITLVVQILVFIFSGIITFWVCSSLGETSRLHLVERGLVCVFLPNIIYALCYVQSKHMKKVLTLITSILKK